MLGKQKCRMLKEIRQRIADENDIPYVTRECSYQGNCSGTCPRCESELRYLEQQLALRASLGKRVAVAALCAGMALGTAGCNSVQKLIGGGTELSGDVVYVDDGPEEPEICVTSGEVAWPEEPEDIELPKETEPPEASPVPIPPELELSGMVAYDPEDCNG